jgi:tRNA(Ile)-lysidine synthetase-like protein
MSRHNVDQPVEDARAALATVPHGAWAVGVSGGADSVALLALLHERQDLRLHVVHLNHETRGRQSDADAEFVACLAAWMDLPCTIARLHDVAGVKSHRNDSAHYRAARLATFSKVVKSHGLQGVILAHHADDQAETVFQRLLRGGGPTALAGIGREGRVGGLLILHPLLSIARSELRRELEARGVSWRDDDSNASPRYLRNRLRRVLERHAPLRAALVQLGKACAAWRGWLDAVAPHLPETFDSSHLQDLAGPLADRAARRWLRARGVDGDDLSPAVVGRLVAMARDAATPLRQHFPGRMLVRRRRGQIFVDRPPGDRALRSTDHPPAD